MNDRIELRSDNAAGVAPEILTAIAGANSGGALAYGGDDWTARLQQTVADVFEDPDVRVFPVVSGTAANALALAALCPPWGAVLGHETRDLVLPFARKDFPGHGAGWDSHSRSLHSDPNRVRRCFGFVPTDLVAK